MWSQLGVLGSRVVESVFVSLVETVAAEVREAEAVEAAVIVVVASAVAIGVEVVAEVPASRFCRGQTPLR
jgi:hypothetical protein